MLFRLFGNAGQCAFECQGVFGLIEKLIENSGNFTSVLSIAK